MKKSLFLFFLFIAGALAAFAQGERYQQELDIIFQSFQKKDYSLLKPLLDKQVKIGSLPTGMNDAVVPQVLKQLPAPISYKVFGEILEGTNSRIVTEYQYAGGNKRRQTFLFNEQKKIVDLDVLGDAKVATMSMTASAPTALPDRFEVPFEVRGHIIFVKAMLNGKEETFILDSGSPLLILNAAYFPSDSVSGAMAQGVGGNVEMGRAHATSFDWHGIKMNDFDVVTLSLEHLEHASHKHFVGLIGYNVFKDYAMTYDYKKKVITFEKSSVANTNSVTPIATIPFKMTAHIPIIPVTISGKTYKMGIDCGASANLLYAKYIPDLEDNMMKKKRRKLSGAGHEKTRAIYAKIKTATCGAATYTKMNFAFDDANLVQLNDGYGLGIDGLVGYEFLRQYRTTVDYTKNEMKIYSLD